MSRGNEPSGIWEIAGASVRGAAHVHFNIPNQDAAKWFVGPQQRSFGVAVADGHGAAVHSRSDRGAQFAVSIAIAELRAVMDSDSVPAGRAATTPHKRILDRWRQDVQADLTNSPLTEAEAGALAAHGLDAISAYGATLLAACISQDFGLAIQLGDGTTYLVDSDGKVVTALKPPELPGESTYSLCMPDALDVIQARSFDTAELSRLAAIVISTDGYNKSFRDDDVAAAQIKTMTDRLRWDNAGLMSRELEDWLQRVSEAGSGDDISLVVAARRTRAG